MNLVVDQGNTRIKVALFSDDVIIASSIFENNDTKGFAQWIKPYNTDRCILSSVSDSELIINTLRSFGIDPFILDSTTSMPFINGYKTPETLGKDRLAAVAGAWSERPDENSLVIDAGTAVTYDFIENSGIYRGGNISPGLEMRYKALHVFTQKLPLVSFSDPKNRIGDETNTAINNGVFYGMIHEIAGVMEHYYNNYQDINVFITGGDAEKLVKYLKSSIFVHPELVLIGLNRILLHNAEK